MHQQDFYDYLALELIDNTFNGAPANTIPYVRRTKRAKGIDMDTFSDMSSLTSRPAAAAYASPTAAAAASPLNIPTLNLRAGVSTHLTPLKVKIKDKCGKETNTILQKSVKCAGKRPDSCGVQLAKITGN